MSLRSRGQDCVLHHIDILIYGDISILQLGEGTYSISLKKTIKVTNSIISLSLIQKLGDLCWRIFFTAYIKGRGKVIVIVIFRRGETISSFQLYLSCCKLVHAKNWQNSVARDINFSKQIYDIFHSSLDVLELLPGLSTTKLLYKHCIYIVMMLTIYYGGKTKIQIHLLSLFIW